VTVRTRLLLGFGVVIALLLVPGLFAASRLAQLRHLAVEGRSGQAVAVASLGRMQALASDLDRLERSFVATADVALGQAVRATADSLRAAHRRLAASPYGEQARPLAPVVARIDSLAVAIDGYVAAERLDAAASTLDSMFDEFRRMEGRAAEVAESIDELARRDFSRAEALSASARRRTLLFLLLAVVVGGGVVGWTTHALTSPLFKLRRAMARVADGTFETPENLPYDREDEIGALSQSFRTMTEHLDDLNRAKAEFLGMASHELKTPLNVIAAYAELIEDGLGDEGSERHRSMIIAVAEQADIMAQRVSRLMDISRLDAGTYELAPEPVRVEDLVKGVTSMFQRLVADKNVAVEIGFADSTPESVTVDVDLVREEVLGNLVSNALRFTPEGGRIAIDVEGRDGGVDVTITDSGPGIPEEHRPHIFDKHYTSDRTRAVGSGLGLAIAKEVVELHGGLITLEDSPPGWGARLRVALPLTPATAELEVPRVVEAKDA
jgi:signal transduction histidine kinase